ncbi:MAG: hypothetical protein ACM3NT_02185 [Methylocystaceae bacterium]
MFRIAKVKKSTAQVAATKDVAKVTPTTKKVEEAPKKTVATVTPAAIKAKPAKKK